MVSLLWATSRHSVSPQDVPCRVSPRKTRDEVVSVPLINFLVSLLCVRPPCQLLPVSYSSRSVPDPSASLCVSIYPSVHLINISVESLLSGEAVQCDPDKELGLWGQTSRV